MLKDIVLDLILQSFFNGLTSSLLSIILLMFFLGFVMKLVQEVILSKKIKDWLKFVKRL